MPQERFERSEERLRFIINEVGIGTWDMDLVNNIAVWDERCKALFGVEPFEEVCLQDSLQFVHPADRAALQMAGERAMERRGGGYCDHRFRVVHRHSRQERWLHTTGFTVFDECGKPIRFSGITRDVTESVIAAERAAAAEKQARIAMEAAGAASFSLDMLMGETSCSPALSHLFTGENDHASRDMIVKHLHPDDYIIRERAHTMAQRTHRLRYEGRFVWDDGSIHWIKVIGQFYANENGHLTACYGIAMNIDHEVNARGDQQKLLSILDRSNDLVMCLDVNHRLSYANQAAVKALGLGSSEAIIGRPVSAILPPQTNLVQRRVLEDGEWSGLRDYKNIQTGEVIPVHAHIFQLGNAGESCRMHGGLVARDLRAELATEEALQHSDKLFRTILDQAPVGISLLRGQELVIETANQEILDMWGKTGSVIGKPLIKILPEITSQGFTELLLQVLSTGKAHYGYEVRADIMRRGVLTEAYFSFVYAPLLDTDGKPSGVMVVAIDVTQYVKNKEVLARRSGKV